MTRPTACTILLCGLVLSGCSGPICDLTDGSIAPTVLFADGPDAAYETRVLVTNTGAPGSVVVIARVSGPEGEFERRRVVSLDTDASERLAFIFEEAGAGALVRDDVAYSFRCEPE